LVKKARILLMDSFEEDSLPEAIASELARTAGFVHVSDDKLVASVSVGDTDKETFLLTEDNDDRAVYLSRDDEEDEN